MNGDALVTRLESLPVGVELVALIESLDRATLAGDELAALLAAEHRVVCRFRARAFRTMADIARRYPPDMAFAAVSEIGTALVCTDEEAKGQLALATDLVQRMPEVLDAMLEGRIDEPKAKKFVTKTRPVADPKIVRQIVSEVLPAAPKLVAKNVAARLTYRVNKHDPKAAARRSERARVQRRVNYRDRGDGTAVISGSGLPMEEAAAAIERLDAFALAARRAGDPRTLRQLRADAMVGLLAGTWAGPEPVHRVGVIELTVPLTTLMGLQDLPGELACWGPLCADLARKTSEQMLSREKQRPTVRFTVHDDEGTIVANGTTSRRPPAAMAATVRAHYNRCIFPRCTRPASRCDLDHRIRQFDGGITEIPNLYPLCRKHHRAKDEGGWRYIVMEPGVFKWISPLGQVTIEDRRRFDDEAA